jgi:hypothetical protein
MEGFWIQPIKTQRLAIAPHRWMSSGAKAHARWSNEERPEAILLII